MVLEEREVEGVEVFEVEFAGFVEWRVFAVDEVVVQREGHRAKPFHLQLGGDALCEGGLARGRRSGHQQHPQRATLLQDPVGDAGELLLPFGLRRGTELKVQLVRAALVARASILSADPGARFLQPEPLIHVVPKAGHPSETGASEGARRSQYEAWDMLSGRAWPQLGGYPQALDVVGVNYYPDNQWEHGGTVLAPGDPRRRPLADLLCGVHARYGRPVVVSETGAEAEARVPWLELVAAEVAEARRRGVPVWAICLYPILDHPGWDDDRYCPNGLLAWHPDEARRGVHPDVAAALRAAQRAAEIQEGITS